MAFIMSSLTRDRCYLGLATRRKMSDSIPKNKKWPENNWIWPLWHHIPVGWTQDWGGFGQGGDTVVGLGRTDCIWCRCGGRWVCTGRGQHITRRRARLGRRGWGPDRGSLQEQQGWRLFITIGHHEREIGLLCQMWLLNQSKSFQFLRDLRIYRLLFGYANHMHIIILYMFLCSSYSIHR